MNRIELYCWKCYYSDFAINCSLDSIQSISCELDDSYLHSNYDSVSSIHEYTNTFEYRAAQSLTRRITTAHPFTGIEYCNESEESMDRRGIVHQLNSKPNQAKIEHNFSFINFIFAQRATQERKQRMKNPLSPPGKIDQTSSANF